MEESAVRILEAVRKDDIKAFSYLVEQKKGLLSLCFGRFPLLSLCYLYNAAKIIEGYEKLLMQTTSYTFAEEDFYSYKRFRARAKTCLRLYSDRRIITPPEMLAVLGDTYRLTYLYPKFAKDNNIDTNIKRIYKTLHSKEPKVENGVLKIKRNKLKPALFIMVIAMIVAAIGMIALPAVALTNITTLTGNGTAENPYKIFGEEQLASAFTDNEFYYVLSKDITLTSNWTPKNFVGNLNGNGHTIYAGNYLSTGLVDNLSGSMENLNILFGELKEDITQNRWLVIKANTGTAANINVSITGAFTESGSDNDIYLSCFALENSGRINSCNVKANIEFKGNGGKDVFLTGLAAWNRGTINNCSLAEGSALTGDSVDLSGIVTENGETGIIENCNNNAAISQTTSLARWSPISAGIVLSNFGKIINCSNLGNITTTTTGDADAEFEAIAMTAGIAATNDGEITDCHNKGKLVSDSINSSTNTGGIVCRNYNKIVKCKNDADISATSIKINALAGGVAAHNTSVVENSCSYGEIKITEGVKYLSFAGGIVGQSDGIITSSYSLANFSVNAGEKINHFFGGIMGLAGTNAKAQTNYYLGRQNVKYGNGAILSFLGINEGNNVGAAVLTGTEEIKALEVYWG